MYLTHKQEFELQKVISMSKNDFFGLQNTAIPLGHSGIFSFSTLNLMIFQTVRNWHLRFGGHVGIQVSSKILRLDVLRKTQSLQNPPCIE
jgi:hypothetical protein